MKIHIQRKHVGIGQPIGSGSQYTSAEFIPGMSNLGRNGRYHHTSPDYGHHLSKKLEESPPLPPPTSNERDASDKL